MCPKCGSEKHRIRYHKGRHLSGLGTGRCNRFDYGNKTYSEEPDDAEHLHVYCETCLYDWRRPVK